MTSITSHPVPTGSSPRPFPFLRLALAALLLGLALTAVGLRFSYLANYDLPWQLVSQTSDGQGHDRIEIRTDDGRVYAFTGDPIAADAWFRSTDGELRARYGLDDRENLGTRLSIVGFLLLAAGVLLAACGGAARYTRRVLSHARK